jgi:tetratricopeptide (TPR) repeat protein
MVSVVALSLLLSWIQVKSDTFVVKSSAGEERAKLVLKELEAFHQLIGTLVFEKAQLPELPIEVLLIGDEAQLIQLAPDASNGREVTGYYQRGQDRDFIVMSGRVLPRTLTNIVYHELTHYFLSRALAERPTWLNEGLAEYFATAEIADDNIYLGRISENSLRSLKTNRLLPLEEFFAVGPDSPYYNETRKANVFYAQAWAFVHYMQNRRAEAFKLYIEALTQGRADLFDYVKMSRRDLEMDFNNYLDLFIRRTGVVRLKAASERPSMTVEAIPDAEAQMTIAEIFISMGRLAEARTHLESVARLETEFPRASYYRGVLARLSGAPGARDLFVDALVDEHLGPLAAVNLVQMGDGYIPAVRSSLEKAASRGTHTSAVYWALSEIYLNDLLDIEEVLKLQNRNVVTPPPHTLQSMPVAETARARYAEGTNGNFKFQLLSESALAPQLQTMVTPYYPEELLSQRLGGEVVLDLQLTDKGEVGRLWLVSATPDVFSSLATEAVRRWKFEESAAKIRVILEFLP